MRKVSPASRICQLQASSRLLVSLLDKYVIICILNWTNENVHLTCSLSRKWPTNFSYTSLFLLLHWQSSVGQIRTRPDHRRGLKLFCLNDQKAHYAIWTKLELGLNLPLEVIYLHYLLESNFVLMSVVFFIILSSYPLAK